AIHISTSLVTLYIDIIFTYSPSTPMSYRFAYTTLFRSSVMTRPVPPTMPLATPPATPRPEKSRASNFWFRSTGGISVGRSFGGRSEEHTSELQSRENFVCRLVVEL